MLSAGECKRRALENLKGNWMTMIGAMFIYGLLVGFASIIVEGPLSYGMAKMSLGVARGEDARFETLFDGFYCFVKTLILGLLIAIFVFLWSLLFVIPGIIKAYSYSMSYYISVDNPSLTAEEARLKSMKLMDGNKWDLFCLHFSFIGWILLVIVTFGLAAFFVLPYMQAAQAEFYNDLVADEASTDGASNVENGGTQSGIFCSVCGAVSPTGAAFCGKCGSRLVAPNSLGVRYCPRCGAECKKDAAFCGKCGNKLPEQEKPVDVICPACGAACDADAVVCTQCGRKFPISRNWNDEPQKPEKPVCPECGTENVAGAVYCKKCGCRLQP